MFTWLNKQGVRSDKGFEVQFTGRFDAQYREDDKVVSLHVEDGTSGGLAAIIVDPRAFKRWDSGVPIEPAKQAELFQNLRDAMDFQGLKLVIEAAEEPPRGVKFAD
jgi:hypothetical protein